MKKSEKRRKRLLLNTRRSVVIVAMIAVLVLVINMITASYSWFTPQSESKRGMQYSFEGKMRSEDCEMSQFTGEKLTSGTHTLEEGQYWGQMVYSAGSGSVSVAAGETKYFKTEIINRDEVNASDISLYIKGLSGCTLAVTYPGNTVRTIPSGQTADVYIVRDAYVKRKDMADVNGPGKLEIEWFVTGISGSTSVDFDNIYLVYN